MSEIEFEYPHYTGQPAFANVLCTECHDLATKFVMGGNGGWYGDAACDDHFDLVVQQAKEDFPAGDGYEGQS